MKKLSALMLAVFIMFSLSVSTAAADFSLDETVPHAIVMEKKTGAVIWEKDADTKAAPASVTKVMTILLIVEALDRGEVKLEDTVTASAHACSMGGSQIYLKEGECMTLRDMLKSIVVASANDAAVAVAEHLCGTEESFVSRMNSRAKKLSMQNTNFTNCTGLFDDDNHYTTARDVAIMARELISHDIIKDYTTIWMDTVRDGEFGLSNTNKLVRRYEGCTGLKTGYTSRAGHCLAATAERAGTEYIAVVMGAQSSESRFEAASAMLNFAFSNFTLVKLLPQEAIPPVRVAVGRPGSLQPVMDGENFALLPKADANILEYSLQLPDSVEAPVEAGKEIGSLTVRLDDKIIAQLPLVCPENIPRRNPLEIFMDLFSILYGE